ncbi:MAG: hypothetical protein DME57_06480 [Verrucomicrobia bacterium]|nr:MAG: hypothetical protein DME57_06480 [Verrucomicrobiota bacterium]
MLLVLMSSMVAVVDLASATGEYQPTRDGKTLVWNNAPKPDDEATWSGRRDRDGFAQGFGTLVWYSKEAGIKKPQLFARYWGNMTRGKFSGPVNVHSKKKTHHAIFADGARVTPWTPGPARSRMNAQQLALIEQHSATAAQEPEPEAPAAGPTEQIAESGEQDSERAESVLDIRGERSPKIDIDESLRILVFPPRSLRVR